MAQRELQREKPNHVFYFHAHKAFNTTPHGALSLILRHLSMLPAFIHLLLYILAAGQLHSPSAHGSHSWSICREASDVATCRAPRYGSSC